MENSFVVGIVSEFKVVVVALTICIYVPTCGAMELEPRISESSTFAFREMPAELLCTSAQSWENLTEMGINVFRPIGGMRIEANQLSQYGLTEFNASGVKGVSSRQINGDESGKNSDKTSNDWGVLAQAILDGLIGFPLMIYAAFLGSNPNVKLRGAP